MAEKYADRILAEARLSNSFCTKIKLFVQIFRKDADVFQDDSRGVKKDVPRFYK